MRTHFPVLEIEASSCHQDMESEEDLLLPVNLDLVASPSRGSNAHHDRAAISKPRMHFIDALRALLTVTVIIHHCFYIYWLGWWPYYGYWLPSNTETYTVVAWTVLSFNQVRSQLQAERHPHVPGTGYMHGDPDLMDLNFTMQAYFMGLFFLIAGHFAAPSLRFKGPRRYLAGRAVRLLIPAAVFEVLLAPLSCMIAKGVNTFNVPAGLADAPFTYAWYWKNYAGVGANPMWFVLALFLFDLGLIAWTAATGRFGWRKPPGSLPLQKDEAEVSGPQGSYSTVSMGVGLLMLMAGLSTLCYLVRTVFPIGFWLPAVFPGFQLAYFGQYITAFALGVAAHSSNALARLPKAWGYGCAGAALAWFVIGWFGVLLLAGSNSAKGVEDAAAPMMGGLGMQALYYAAFEQGFAVLWGTGVLVLGREHLNAAPSSFGVAVIGAAYCAYVVHPVIVYGLTRALTSLWLADGSTGNVLGHVLIECPLAVLLTWAFAMAIKTVPGTGRVL